MIETNMTLKITSNLNKETLTKLTLLHKQIQGNRKLILQQFLLEYLGIGTGRSGDSATLNFHKSSDEILRFN